jgi:hypothetical protein
MKIFNIEIKGEEIWNFILFPFRNIFKFRVTRRKNFNEFLNNITWEYQIPRFKLKRNIRKEDISHIRPLCRKCLCELRCDFVYPIKRTTYYVFKFTCSNCHLVHDINAESLEDFLSDLKRKLAYYESHEQTNQKS